MDQKFSENLEESIASLNLLCEEFSETSEQTTRFLEIYDRLAEKVKERWGMDAPIPDIRNFQKPPISGHAPTQKVLEKLKSIKIPRAVYIKLLQGYIDAMGLHQKVISNPNASSIFDGPETLEIPSSKSYDNMPLDGVLGLMIHEIGAHYANQETSAKIGFQIRGAKNIEKEEGLAMVLEGLFEGRKLANIKVAGYSYPYILAGELLSREERQDLADLRLRMDRREHGDEGHKRDLRVMRGYPLDGPGAQRKDASYGRGKNKIVDLVLSKKCSISDLYKGKFSIDDIVTGRLDALVPKESIVFPLLFPEMILFLAGTGREGYTHAVFMDYLREKYAGDLSEEELNNIETIKAFSQLKIFMTMWREVEGYLIAHDASLKKPS